MTIETGTTAVATMITKEHDKIGSRLVDKVRGLLATPGLEIKSYELTDEPWNKSETIKFQIDEKRSLVIQVKNL